VQDKPREKKFRILSGSATPRLTKTKIETIIVMIAPKMYETKRGTSPDHRAGEKCHKKVSRGETVGEKPDR